jgi:hypothetical protein
VCVWREGGSKGGRLYRQACHPAAHCARSQTIPKKEKKKNKKKKQDTALPGISSCCTLRQISNYTKKEKKRKKEKTRYRIARHVILLHNATDLRLETHVQHAVRVCMVV